MSEQSFYAYVVSCSDGTLYTGWSTDPARRLLAHNSGTGARYTRPRRPVKLLATWRFDSKQEAMRFEWAFKQLSRPQKLQAIAAAEKI